MPTTSTGLRYPLLSDTPNVPRDIQYLAEDLDSNVGAMRALLAQFYI